MKKQKKVLAALLSLTTLIGSASCSSSRDASSTAATTSQATVVAAATADPNAELNADIDWDEKANIDSVDAANEEGTGPAYTPGQKAGHVKALCYYDIVADAPEIAELFAERYGGTLETEITSSGNAYFEKLGTLIAAGLSPDLVRYDWAAYPDGISRNRYTALDEWLDIESPLWSDIASIIDSFEYLGKHYYFPQNAQSNFAIIYNRRLVEEEAMPDPADLYFAGEWDWDAFESMIKQWAGKGEDYIGYTGGSWSSMMFINTTGTKTIDLNGTEIINNLKSQQASRTMNWLESLQKQGFIGEGYIHPGDAFKDGKLLFLGMGLTWGIESAQECLFKNNIEGEIVAVPFPRDPQADKYYLASDTFGYMVPAGAQNIQGAVQWILSARIYETDPDVVAEKRAEWMYDGPTYYPKCPECKFNCEEAGFADSATCPECNAARKLKFKPIYTEEQLQINDDMINPEKFELIFDSPVGFNEDFQEIFINGDDSVFDGPLYHGASYTQLVEEMYNMIEAHLEPYREALASGTAVAG